MNVIVSFTADTATIENEAFLPSAPAVVACLDWTFHLLAGLGAPWWATYGE